MGAATGRKQGRPAVAIAAVLFYAFLSTWLPGGFAAPYGSIPQQSVVLDLADDGDEDLLTGAGELAALEAKAAPEPGWPVAPAQGPTRAPRFFTPLVATARGPPSLNV